MHTQTLKTRVRSSLICGVMLVACADLGHAQSPGAPATASTGVPQAKGRVLYVTALDAKGRPATDLTGAELKIFDNGKRQPITSFNSRPTQATRKTLAPTTLVLFDLLNMVPGQRVYLTSRIVRALEPLEMGDLVYLYLLTNRGDLYPVRALPEPLSAPSNAATAENPTPGGGPWTRQVHPVLEQAIQKVYGFRSKDYHDFGALTGVTFRALGKLGDQFMAIPGPKTMVWITQGVSNWVGYPYGCQDAIFGEGSESYLAGKCGNGCSGHALRKCINYTPFLEHFGAKLVQSDTILYCIYMNTEGSIAPPMPGWPRDTLQKLADLSGGRLYLNGEVEKAIAQSSEVGGARYQITYDAPTPDGKYHKLRVECSRKGVRIVSPHAYFAEQPLQVASSR
jgi:VWFA-related protein